MWVPLGDAAGAAATGGWAAAGAFGRQTCCTACNGARCTNRGGISAATSSMRAAVKWAPADVPLGRAACACKACADGQQRLHLLFVGLTLNIALP